EFDENQIMDQLTGTIALVTGGGRGIGRAISVALARAGCDVAVNFRERREDAEAAVHEIRALGRRAVAVQADVSRAAHVAKLVRETESELGPIEILVNNAGKILIEPIEKMTEESWNDMIASNLTSCFLVTQAVLAGMRSRKWGRIINLSSVAAQAGSIVGVHYAASKAGMLGLTRSYARVLAKEGITVNAITPALVATEMVRSNPVAKPDMIPIGRFGEVDEVADVVVMLAGNGYITGQTVNVNGGYYMS
ncbi:MAG TPA: SDR family NAD(P)-dependent oxidoreductase, partial [Bryobacteraceae bacterium]|nr:SDR family NAD(P)-dependent oxidoreductase [Bryobacteraceae bacterium]